MNYFRALAATSSTRAATSTTPSTAAGETYRGISRRYNPGWLGWRASMRPKARSRAGNWTRNPVLAGLMEEFYRAGLEAELSALSDEELHARIAELSGVTAEEVRAWTPEECRRLEEEIGAKLSEGEVPPVIPEQN